jgi:MFS transporter, putative metabolite:H+ symporter
MAGQSLQAAVTERLDNLKSFKVGVWSPIAFGLMMLGDSWDISVMAYVIAPLKDEWGLNPLQMGGLMSSGFFGQLIGAIVVAPLAERFGRMPVFNLGVIGMCVFSLACAAMHDPNIFMGMRVAQGIALGAVLPIGMTYINELAPTASRGRYFSLSQFLMVAGFSLCAMAAAWVVPNLGWRWMFIIGAYPMLLVPFVIMTLPESPRWLARLGRRDATNKALRKLGAAPVDESVVSVEQEREPQIPVSALLEKETRWLTIFSCVLWFFTSLVAYGFSSWTPYFYEKVFMLKRDVALQYSGAAAFIYMFTPLLYAAILDKIGRRPPGIVIAMLTLVNTITLTIIATTHVDISVLLLAVGWITSGASFVLLWPYTAEIFPTKMRSTGLGLCSAAARAASMLTPFVVTGLIEAKQPVNYVFAVFAVSTLFVFLLWVFTSKEMKGKALDEGEV